MNGMECKRKIEQSKKMASPTSSHSSSSPYSWLFNSLPNDDGHDHRNHHHSHLPNNEQSYEGESLELKQRRRTRRLRCQRRRQFSPYNYNQMRFYVLIPHTLHLINLVLYILLSVSSSFASPTSVYFRRGAQAQAILYGDGYGHGPKNVVVSPLMSKSLIQNDRNNTVGEGEEEGGEEGGGTTSRNSGELEEVAAERVGDLSVIAEGMQQIQHGSGGGGDLHLSFMLGPRSRDSARNMDEGNANGVEDLDDVSLFNLLEEAELVNVESTNDNLTTMELLFGAAFGGAETSNEGGRGAADLSPSPMFSSSSSSSSSIIRVPVDIEISPRSTDSSSSFFTANSPAAQPPQLSPQNGDDSDLLYEFQFSPPHLQQEGVEYQPNELESMNPFESSPGTYTVVNPNDVLPEVIVHQNKTPETEPPKNIPPLEEDAVSKVVEPVASSSPVQNIPDTETSRDLPALPLVSSKVATGKPKNRRKKTIRNKSVTVKTPRKYMKKNNAGSSHPRKETTSSQLEGQNEKEPPTASSPSSILQSSTQRKSPIESETAPSSVPVPLTSFQSLMDVRGTESRTEFGDDSGAKLPPFHEIKKRQLPHSVFKEHTDASGRVTYIAEEDEAIISSLDVADLPSAMQAKRRHIEVKSYSSQSVLGTLLQQQDISIFNRGKINPASPRPFPGNVFSQIYKNGIAARRGGKLSQSSSSLSSPVNATSHDTTRSTYSTGAQPATASISSSPGSYPGDFNNNHLNMAHGNPSLFKVPAIRQGRQKRQITAADYFPQAPTVSLGFRPAMQQQQLEFQPSPQTTQQQTAIPNHISNRIVPFQYPAAAATDQLRGPQWRSQFTPTYNSASSQPSLQTQQPPSYNQHQAQYLQQQKQDVLSFEPGQQQYMRKMSGTPFPPASPSSEGVLQPQQQVPMYRQHAPQSLLLQQPVEQNPNQYSLGTPGPLRSPSLLELQRQSMLQNTRPFAGTPMPPSSPFPVSSSHQQQQQQIPIYGQYSPQFQRQSMVQNFPVNSPQSPFQRQALAQNAVPYAPPATHVPLQSPSPSISPMTGNIQQQQLYSGYGHATSRQRSQGVVGPLPPSTYAYGQQGQSNSGREGQPFTQRNPDMVTMSNQQRTRYNIALQLQRLQMQRQAMMANTNSGNSPKIDQQYSPSVIPPTNYYQPQPQYYYQRLTQQIPQNNNNMPLSLQQPRMAQPMANQQFSQSSATAAYPPPPYTPYNGMQGQNPSAWQGNPQNLNTYGTGRAMPSSQYSPQVISGGEDALYRSRMGWPQMHQFPTGTRGANSNSWTGGDASVGNQVAPNVGTGLATYLDQANGNSYNGRVAAEHTRPAAASSSSNVGDAPPSPMIQTQPQQNETTPVIAPQTETDSQSANVKPAGGSENPHSRNRLPHQGGSSPFYSQSQVDAHHSRVTENHQTSKDSEFENETKILSWYLNTAKQVLHNNPKSSSPQQRPSSVHPRLPDLLGHPATTARPSSAHPHLPAISPPKQKQNENSKKH